MVRALASSSSPGNVHFYCSSGGNAGLACASSALSLSRPATIVLPTSSSALMQRKLLALGVHVQVVGDNWAEADKFLREELVAKNPGAVYVPPFDHPDVWDGASSLVTELAEQMGGRPIHGIVLSVGGGGLLNGVMQGITSLYPAGGAETPPRVLAVETVGADSLNASVVAGEHVTLPAITSIAKSLGATRVSSRTWEWARDRPDIVESLTVSDADAAMSCVRFADDARLLVEVSCGASLAVCYRGELRQRLGSGLTDDEWTERNVVIEVCGGAGVTLEVLAAYAETYGKEASFKC